MKTASLSATVTRLTNDELGLLQRRVNEIVRRAEEGSIELPWAMAEMQRIIEGKRLPEIRYMDRARKLEFVRPSADKLKKSKAPISKRLSQWLKRLEWPERDAEQVMAEMWEAECIPENCINFGLTPLDAILHGEEITDRDVQVVNSTLQWLGTNIGKEFLRRFVRTIEMYVN